MTEYFVVTNSFAAPFFSDSGETFVHADSPASALEKVASEYRHPFGLYAAACYASADAYHKNADPLARWMCNRELKKQEVTKGKGSYSFLGISAGTFEIDGERFEVENPKGGRVV